MERNYHTTEVNAPLLATGSDVHTPLTCSLRKLWSNALGGHRRENRAQLTRGQRHTAHSLGGMLLRGWE